MADFCCPMCAAELSIEALFAHAEMREAFAKLVRWSVPAGSKVLAYITLFAPAKNRQTLARKAKLLDELMPDLLRQAVNRKGRDWAAPPEVWAAAIEQMLQNRDQLKLELPLTSHGYLYEVIVGIAKKAESAAETEAEQAKRRSPDTVTYRGHTMTISEGLQAAYGGKDPALAKAESDKKLASPVPEHVREFAKKIKKGG